MKILLTGGSGYLGKKLIASMGDNITCLDKTAVAGCSFLEGDIRDPSLDLSDFDLIFHFAAVSAPKLVEKDRDLAWDVNVNGTMNICKKMKKVQKIIFMSSAYVYDRKREKHKETEAPDPTNFYGLTKLSGENLIRYYSNEIGFDYVIFRLFNSYSIDQKAGLIIGDLMKKYREDPVIEVFNPRTKMDMVHVDDVIGILSKSASIPNGTYNICSGASVTVQDVYDEVSRLLKIEKPTKIVSDKNNCLIGDNSKLKELGFSFRQFRL